MDFSTASREAFRRVQTAPPSQPRNVHEERYRAWRRTHERVYQMFLERARQRLVRRQRFGIKALVEVVRWDVAVAIEKDAAGFRLNNNSTAYLARDLCHDLPGLDQLIELRRVE